jgi:hypothetical protein
MHIESGMGGRPVKGVGQIRDGGGAGRGGRSGTERSRGGEGMQNSEENLAGKIQ